QEIDHLLREGVAGGVDVERGNIPADPDDDPSAALLLRGRTGGDHARREEKGAGGRREEHEARAARDGGRRIARVICHGSGHLPNAESSCYSLARARSRTGRRRGDAVTTYVLRRLLAIVPLALGVLTLVFLILQLLPGGPF